jgi:inner membrane transporter RhtA
MAQAASVRWIGVSSTRGSAATGGPPAGGTAASRPGGPLLVLGSSASLQSSAALATTVFAVYGPVGTGALRFGIAAPVLLLVARPGLRGRPRAFWPTVVALGFALAALNFTLFEAIDRVPLATVVTLQFLGPLALALAGTRRPRDLAWVAAAGIGVSLITGGPSGGSTVGVTLALAAAVITTLTLVLSRRLATSSHGLDGIAVAVAVAACITLPAALSAATATGAAYELAIVAAVALLGLAIPYALEYVAIRTVTLKTFSVLLSLDPAVAALAGAAWLGQRLSPPELAGVGLVVLASAGATATRAPSGGA